MTSANFPTIGIDIGGTCIKAAVVAIDGTLIEQVTAPTPKTVHETEDGLVALVQQLMSRHRVSAVGLAVAGFIAADRQSVMFAPHLAWRDAPVPALLKARLGIPVVMDHDVNAAAYAEYRMGASVGAQVGLLIALGTGIGTGLLVDGRMFRGAYGVAPELGHLRVVADGRPCSCGKSGCWERYCSGTALAQTAAELAISLSSEHLRQLTRGDLSKVTGAMVGKAALAGEPASLAAVADLARWLGLGIGMAIDIFDPDVIVIGGGVSKIADLFLDDAIKQATAGTSGMTGAGHRPVPAVVRAHFGDAAGVIGAALLAADQQRTG